MKNVRTITHDELKWLIKRSYKKNLEGKEVAPLFVWGATGIGKSYVCRQVAMDLAQEFNLEFSENGTEENREDTFGFEDVRISQMRPEDIRGVPTFDEDRGVVIWNSPRWLELTTKGKGILFFDEMNLAEPSISAPCYQIINRRRIGRKELSDGWYIVSAGNRFEDKANVFELPDPLKNRFRHVELGVPSVEDWSKWASGVGVDSRIIGFLHFKRSYLFKHNPQSNEKAFATPRAWEKLSNSIEGVKNDYDKLELLAQSYVGEGVGLEFVSFVKMGKKIDIGKILAKPERVKEYFTSDAETSLKWSVVSGVVAEFKKNRKVLSKVFKVARHLPEEFAVFLLRMIKHSKHKRYVQRRITDNKDWEYLISEDGKDLGKFLVDY